MTRIPTDPRTDSAAIRRLADRARTDLDDLHAVLDASLVGSLAIVSSEGLPWCVPMLYARDGERVLLHGSRGAGALGLAARGVPAALSVVLLDGIVVAETLFDSSANYRSAVVHGTLTALDGDDKKSALEVLSDRMIPGRVSEVRESTRKELAATTVLAMAVERWTVKVRDAPPSEPSGADRGGWAGVVPLESVARAAQPASWIAATTPVPASVHALLRGGGADGGCECG